MTAQQSILVRIRAEQETTELLAAASQAEAEAVRAVVDATVRRAQAEEARAGLIRNIISIALGFVLGIGAGVLGNFAYAFIT